MLQEADIAVVVVVGDEALGPYPVFGEQVAPQAGNIPVAVAADEALHPDTAVLVAGSGYMALKEEDIAVQVPLEVGRAGAAPFVRTLRMEAEAGNYFARMGRDPFVVCWIGSRFSNSTTN